jgi:hypothetical protein
MFEQYVGLNGYLGTTDRAVLLTNGSGGLTAQASGLTLSAQNCLTIPGSTITASEPLLNLSQAWNNAGVTFTGIKFNATDTASASGSLLADFQVGGSSKFSISKIGLVVSQSAIRGTDINATSSIGQLSINFDTILTRDAANTLALRNGVNAQAFNIYNTYTSGTNYERLTQTWATNVCKIWTEKGSGGGTARDLVLGAGATELVRFQTGSKIGFFGVTPVARPAAYTVTNGATDRAYDASATTVGELANVLNTLIADLRGLGLVA